MIDRRGATSPGRDSNWPQLLIDSGKRPEACAYGGVSPQSGLHHLTKTIEPKGPASDPEVHVTRPLDSLEDDFHRGSLLLVTLQQLVLFTIQLFQALGQV
jgi:hypothetical protein